MCGSSGAGRLNESVSRSRGATERCLLSDPPAGLKRQNTFESTSVLGLTITKEGHVLPSPATRSIWTHLEAGEAGCHTAKALLQKLRNFQ